MLVLAINTASSKTAISLLEKGANSKLITEDNWISKNDEAEKLMPRIEKLLKDSKKEFSDIKGVLVIKGPGSFTGLRVGVTVANMIAYLNKAKLYTVDTFEYWWEKLENPIGEKPALLIFAGSRGVYVNFKNSTKIDQINLDELNSFLTSKKVTTTFGDITKEQLAILKDTKFKKINESFGKTCLKILNSNPVSHDMVKPKYVKSPGITQPKCYT